DPAHVRSPPRPRTPHPGRTVLGPRRQRRHDSPRPAGPPRRTRQNGPLQLARTGSRRKGLPHRPHPPQGPGGGARFRRAPARANVQIHSRRRVRASHPTGRHGRHRAAHPGRGGRMISRFRDWVQETHSTGFELLRHFLVRFFDNDMVSVPGEWQKVAGGIFAVLVSVALGALQTYWHRYIHLHGGPFEVYRQGVRDDLLSFLAISMAITALLTILQ